MAAAVQAVLGAVLVLGLLTAAARPGLPPLAPETAVAPPGVRAMWVWDRADPAHIVDWAHRHGVRTLFLHVGTGATDWSWPAAVRERAGAAGIQVDALGGEPGWVHDHERALAWVRSVRDSGLFRGVHLDVEPYLLADWTTRRDEATRGLLTLLDRVAATGVAHVEADLPFWAGTVPVGASNLADEVLARVDAITVMSYRSSATGANSIVSTGTDLLRRAGRAAKPARLAAETQPLADCAHCSFADRSDLAAGLVEVDRAARAYPAFEGVAVHQFSTWSSLPE